MSAPARPRPRPRPRAKPTGSLESTPTTASTVPPAGTTSKTIITINRETLTAAGKTIEVPVIPTVDDHAVIEVPDDDDFDIFAKRRNASRGFRASTDERIDSKPTQPVGIGLSSSGSDYSDDDGHGRRRKRRRSKLESPAWTRMDYKGKEDRIDEETETPINDNAGMPQGQRQPSVSSTAAEKRDRRGARSTPRARSVSLTPPPQIAPLIPMPNPRPTHIIHSILDDDDDLDLRPGYEWKPTSTGLQLGSKSTDTIAGNDDLAALIAKTRAKFAAESHAPIHTSMSGGRAGSATSVGAFSMADDAAGHFIDRGLMLQLTVTMRQDPMRAKVISERALKAYEKPRVFTIGSKCPLDPIYEKLADVLDKEKEDIILTYRGERIWSTNFTPERLKIYTDEKLEGYEKEAWERTQLFNEMERQRKLREAELEIAERHAAVHPPGELVDGENENDDDEIEVTAVHVVRPIAPAHTSAASIPNTGKAAPVLANEDNDDDRAPAEETSAILSMTLRGKEGDVKAKAKPTTKMSALVAYYKKIKKIETEMGIELDGEMLEGDSTVADADLDDGDMLSVVPAR